MPFWEPELLHGQASLNKKILSVKNQWLRHWSKEQAMSVFSFQNSTVNWTPLKWSVTIWYLKINLTIIFSKYWGWCKYWYQELPKSTFTEAKTQALEVLNSCPMDVIRRFINRAWIFMDAYQKGLTGEVAAWVVHKQKSHRSVSESVMKALEAQSKDK